MILAEAPKVGPSIERLKERHFEIMRRLVAGELATDIAHSLGMTDSWLSIVIASPVFQAELSKLREVANKEACDVGSRITKLAPDAMAVLERAIRAKGAEQSLSTMQQVSVARDVLDRAGHGKPQALTQAAVAVKVEIVQFSAPAPQPRVIEGTKEYSGRNSSSSI